MAVNIERTAKGGTQLGALLHALGFIPNINSLTVHEQATTLKPFDTRRVPAYPFLRDAKFLAISIGTTPKFDDEDEMRWLTAVGLAELDTKDLHLLSPGEDGCHWAEEVKTRVLAFKGRQTHRTAGALTSDSEVEHMEIKEFSDYLSRCFDLGGNIVLVYDHFTNLTDWLPSEAPLQGLDRVVEGFDIFEIARTGTVPSTRTTGCPQTLGGLCDRLDIRGMSLRNVGDRARSILRAMITVAVRSAPAPTLPPVLTVVPQTQDRVVTPQSTVTISREQKAESSKGSIQQPKSTAKSPPDVIETSTKTVKPLHAPVAADIPSVKANGQHIVSTTTDTKSAVTKKQPPSDSVVPASVKAASAPSQPLVSSVKTSKSAVAEKQPLPSSVVPASVKAANVVSRPNVSTVKSSKSADAEKQPLSSSVAPDDQTVFTAEDREQVRVSSYEILRLPPRIRNRVERYSVKTICLMNWIIKKAIETGFPRLSRMTCDCCYRKIEGPITNFERLMAHNLQTSDVPTDVIDLVKEIIALRTFVSDWYTNIPGIPKECEVARKTVQHRAFIAMLQGLVPMMERRKV